LSLRCRCAELCSTPCAPNICSLHNCRLAAQHHLQLRSTPRCTPARRQSEGMHPLEVLAGACPCVMSLRCVLGSFTTNPYVCVCLADADWGTPREEGGPPARGGRAALQRTGDNQALGRAVAARRRRLTRWRARKSSPSRCISICPYHGHLSPVCRLVSGDAQGQATRRAEGK
jgi:hypothetical protein